MKKLLSITLLSLSFSVMAIEPPTIEPVDKEPVHKAPVDDAKHEAGSPDRTDYQSKDWERAGEPQKKVWMDG